MSDRSEAFAVFLEAREFFLRGAFDRARRTIDQYRRMVDYDALARTDSRGSCKPVVSVVVVAFSSGDRLAECIDSLGGQTDRDFEIIVVDNGGNEHVSEALSSRSIMLVRPPVNVMPSEGRNIGAFFARGEYIAFVDDDAVVAPDFVQRVREAWRSFDFAAIRGRVLPRSGDANNRFVGHYDLGPYPMPAVLMTEGNMAIKAVVFREIGGFDPLLYGDEGVELTYRCQSCAAERDIYYWPSMVIYHDFARGAKLVEKRRRSAHARRYFRVVGPAVNRLPGRYAKWYRKRPGGGALYDDRSVLEKVKARLALWRLIAGRRSALSPTRR